METNSLDNTNGFVEKGALREGKLEGFFVKD
jgi:hypothetical protein